MGRIRDFLRDLQFRTPIRRFSSAFHKYDYMFSPSQLGFLVRCLDETESLGGSIVEVGCATGQTTVYLNRHLDEIASSRPYLCIDTFAGFTEDDIAHELHHRGKARDKLQGFRINRQEWFDRNLADNGVTRVTSYAADIKQFDLAGVAPKISFCLLDVDLYQPVKVGLERVYPRMVPGGIIVVDDVAENRTFDGAHQAYVEFMRAQRLEPDMRLHKLGVVRLPRIGAASSVALS
jgi:O-methyltransferase